MFTRLRRARTDLTTMNRLLPAAERLARDDGVGVPGAEHLLLAAIDLDDGLALRALGDLGVGPADLRAAIAAQHDDALRSIGVVADDSHLAASIPAGDPPTGVYRSQGSLQVAFQDAVAQAKRARRAVSSGDVLLAVTEPEHGTVARALDHLGLDRDLLRAEVRRILEGAA